MTWNKNTHKIYIFIFLYNVCLEKGSDDIGSAVWLQRDIHIYVHIVYIYICIVFITIASQTTDNIRTISEAQIVHVREGIKWYPLTPSPYKNLGDKKKKYFVFIKSVSRYTYKKVDVFFINFSFRIVENICEQKAKGVRNLRLLKFLTTCTKSIISLDILLQILHRYMIMKKS